MNTKEILQSYKWIKADTQDLMAQRQAIFLEEALPGSIDYSADRVQTSPDDGMLRKVLRIEERTADIDRRIRINVARTEAVDNALNDIVDKRLKKLLVMRYFERKSWKAISVQIKYSEDHTRGYLHGRALKLFEKNYKVNTF